MTCLALTVLCLILISQLVLSSELEKEIEDDSRGGCERYKVYCSGNRDCPRGMKCYYWKARIILLPDARVCTLV